ncbi:thiamine pyrophosphate-binding protein [Actinomadura rugatobispora]|uniref:Thiamine pyrophosphate-binding protein n=1 Tax=Actinomadura rugatobispora TaxID=1994 RepID=A0ABW1ACG2_9ACTN|nr:thiamine pyrophosphate-binding protein [Actinomadura rugatobispora]
MLACEMIARYLRDAGVTVQFGLLGEGNIAVATALDQLGVRFVGARREDAAVSMADGWARRTGSVGFASVTQGPGFTNTVTALTEAARHGTPLVLLTGVTPRADLHNSQRFPTRELVALTGAGWRETRGLAFLADDVRAVFAGALTERRPYVLGVDTSLLYEVADSLLLTGELPETLPEHALSWRARPVTPSPEAIAAGAELLAAAKNPVILAGRGAAAPEAIDAVHRLAEHLDAPLATTLLGKGLLGGDRHIGICGGFATGRGADVIGAADLVLAVGCSLNLWTATELLDGSTIVHIDADPAAIGRWRVPDLGIVGDAHLTCEALLDDLRKNQGAARRAPAPLPPFNRVAEMRRPPGRPAEDDVRAPFLVGEVALAMRECFPPGAVLASDTGQATADIVAYVEPAGPDHFIYPIHAGSIGLGLGTAMGASLAGTGQWTVHFTGDGSLMMALQELATVAEQRLRLIIVVLDDGGYGAEVQYTRGRGIPSHLAAVPHPDLAALAPAFGLDYHRIDTLADLRGVRTIAAGDGGPALVHVPIDPDSASRFFRDYSSVPKVAGWDGGR